ncbi:MAG: hydroxymethylbilane synthase [Erythrobacter sp.]|nr:hydroxymethylbilane synthase [Erythrobacter sp.]
MAQASEARARLCAAHGWDESAVDLMPVIASGDRIQDRPLAEIGGKALWTRELDIWLEEGWIDGSVHSMKDVETLRPEGFAIPAILEREDRADRLLGAETVIALPQGATIGTSAPRRAAQLLHQRPDCSVVTFRGNVATRMAKLAAGDVDATFLAAAGLNRVGETAVGARLDPEDWLPAPGQAAIGIECRAGDEAMQAIFAAIDHRASHDEVMAERALLAGLGGSCHSPVAALSRIEGEELVLRAAIYSAQGAIRIEDEARFARRDRDAPRELARMLLDDAPEQVRVLFHGAA